jgi:hypothetical protein
LISKPKPGLRKKDLMSVFAAAGEASGNSARTGHTLLLSFTSATACIFQGLFSDSFL